MNGAQDIACAQVDCVVVLGKSNQPAVLFEFDPPIAGVLGVGEAPEARVVEYEYQSGIAPGPWMGGAEGKHGHEGGTILGSLTGDPNILELVDGIERLAQARGEHS